MTVERGMPDGGPDRTAEDPTRRGGRLHRSTRRHRWRRWVLRGVGLVVVGLLALGAVLAWLTVNPRVDSADHVDALLVLSTQAGAQEEAHRLAQQGVTDLLIVSVPVGAYDWLCSNAPQGTEAVCFSPDPATTQGEAMGGTAIAREHGAGSLGALTFDHHVERSRLLVERCWDGPVHMYEFQPVRGKRGYLYDFVYAMAAYGKVFLTPGCDTPPPQWLQSPIERVKR
ncbi:hypothetical protein E7744_04475 [Citricoccus sp. SGAir0253]|uniref:hypothetical protein n=1 Tax=Citricoccus sp. SGAir0253 TaxID=2567881 RepID=UPI0010CCD7F9|nr:hypothetical protein [Citricoccus sp. SGAir0253]QCU77557.1 hypothetical protein E7744_04475 [Citricoccus sp. SGAir0253]